jgi:hypothetical protein
MRSVGYVTSWKVELDDSIEIQSPPLPRVLPTGVSSVPGSAQHAKKSAGEKPANGATSSSKATKHRRSSAAR